MVEAGIEIHRLRAGGCHAEARALLRAANRLPWPYPYLADLVFVGLTDGWLDLVQVRSRLAVTGTSSADAWLDWLERIEDESIRAAVRRQERGLP